jgi:hypothetical protein
MTATLDTSDLLNPWQGGLLLLGYGLLAAARHLPGCPTRRRSTTSSAGRHRSTLLRPAT